MSENNEKDIFELLEEEGVEEVKENTNSGTGVDSKEIEDLISIYDNDWKGTGDVIEDLVLWLNNDKALPSDDLSAFSGNFKQKAKAGMYIMALKTISMLPTVIKYKEEAEKIVFDTSNLGDIDTDDLMDRLEKANSTTLRMLDNVRRILTTIDNMDEGDREDSDRLKMLLASLPKNKIKDLLEKLK